MLWSFGNTVLNRWGLDCEDWRATLFLLSQMDQIPKRKSRCHGIRWCQEVCLEVQLACSQSEIGKLKEEISPEGGQSRFQKLTE